MTAGAAAALLRRLEEHLDRAGELVLAIGQDTGDAEQHGRVGVVAAGVHLAVDLRAIRHVVLFVDRQRVHIGPEEDDLARPLAAADQAGYAGHRDAGADVFDTDRAQPLGNDLRRLEFLESELGVLVELPPVRDHAWHDLIDFAAQSFYRRNHERDLPALRHPAHAK